MNIQNRTKCLLQPSRLFPSIWSHANHKYLGTYHLLCQDNKNPWKFRSMKCNRDVRQILRNCYIKLLFLECKIQNWQRLRGKYQTKNLVELFYYISLVASVQISMFNRRYRTLDWKKIMNAIQSITLYYNVHSQRIHSSPCPVAKIWQDGRWLLQLLLGTPILDKNESAVADVIKACHTQVIYDTGRWEYSSHGYEMVYASAIFERLNKKELYLSSQRVYIYISIFHYTYLYVHVYLKQRAEFNSVLLWKIVLI